MKNSCIILLLGLTTLLMSCASSYHSVSPRLTNLPALSTNDEITFAYKYDVLRANGNKKYAKKENRNGIRLVAVSVTNNTGRSLRYPDDLELVSGNRIVYPIETELVYKELKQGVPIYLLYMLFTFMRLDIQTPTESSSTPIGLAIGPGLTTLNISIAASANSQFKNDLMLYNLNNQTINDGETVYGLIGIPDNAFAPLELKLK